MYIEYIRLDFSPRIADATFTWELIECWLNDINPLTVDFPIGSRTQTAFLENCFYDSDAEIWDPAVAKIQAPASPNFLIMTKFITNWLIFM